MGMSQGDGVYPGHGSTGRGAKEVVPSPVTLVLVGVLDGVVVFVPSGLSLEKA